MEVKLKVFKLEEFIQGDWKRVEQSTFITEKAAKDTAQNLANKTELVTRVVEVIAVEQVVGIFRKE